MSQTDTRLISQSEAETVAIGRELARGLGAGSIVLLQGDLGTGKTAFVRGLAEGCGVDPDDVSSPTFTLVQEYHTGRLPVFHADLYRLENDREVDELGLEELTLDGVLAVEWAEKLPRPPRDALVVSIEHGIGDMRVITIRRGAVASPADPAASARP